MLLNMSAGQTYLKISSGEEPEIFLSENSWA